MTNECVPAIEQLTVTLSGPGDTLSGLTAGDVTPALDVSGLAPGSYNLEPTIGVLPDGVELLGISPGTVAVTIRAPRRRRPRRQRRRWRDASERTAFVVRSASRSPSTWHSRSGARSATDSASRARAS